MKKNLSVENGGIVYCILFFRTSDVATPSGHELLSLGLYACVSRDYVISVGVHLYWRAK